MDQLFRLLKSMFKRVTTAVSMPFRMLMVRIQKLFNVNIISSKLIKPLTSSVKKLFTLKPANRADYVSILGLWVYKKVFGFLILAGCAFVFIYFGTIAPKVQPAPTEVVGIKTDITFDYDDVDLKDFSGIANIRDYEGNVIYTGEINAGVCQGMGTLYTKEGAVLYEGQFDNNQYNGAGVRYVDGVKVYEGSFADNLREGEGKEYDAEGNLIYEGLFKAGAYDGEGKLWGSTGILEYEGRFAAGLPHGQGRHYFADGKLEYEGEFFEGRFQGVGTLYNQQGQLLYTGAMFAGKIDHTAYLGATLADAAAAFAETPTIFYQNNGYACYLYEKAGVILTTDCQVRVLEWQRPADGEEGGTWYMPGENGGTTYYSANTAYAGARFSSSSSSSSPASSSSSEAQSSSSSEAQPEGWPDQGSLPLPDFVDKYKVLYFEVDKDVWEYEAEKYESKVFIQRVTVLGAPTTVAEPGEADTILSDDPPPGLEDCVAIDTLRKSLPTAFPHVHFEMDKQNKLFQRVWNINFADSIDRFSYARGSMTYRYNYLSGEDGTPAYYTIEG